MLQAGTSGVHSQTCGSPPSPSSSGSGGDWRGLVHCFTMDQGQRGGPRSGACAWRRVAVNPLSWEVWLRFRPPLIVCLARLISQNLTPLRVLAGVWGCASRPVVGCWWCKAALDYRLPTSSNLYFRFAEEPWNPQLATAHRQRGPQKGRLASLATLAGVLREAPGARSAAELREGAQQPSHFKAEHTPFPET